MAERTSEGQEVIVDGQKMQLASKFPIRGASQIAEEIAIQTASNPRVGLATGSVPDENDVDQKKDH